MEKHSSQRGFTLVETLVAITILVTAVLGSFSAAQSGISSSIFSKDQVIAFYLAAEGVEQIRNIRDENALKGNSSWLAGLDACFNGACTVNPLPDSGQPIVTSCNGSDNCPMLQQNPGGFYGYGSGWTNTIFKRTITLMTINNNPNEVSILVSLTWSKGLVNRQFDVRENILNWQ